jgi:hypothetical protein
MTIEMMCIEWVIENEIEQGIPQKSIALSYAFGLRASTQPDWARINKAILAKFGKTGLNRIKTRAWRLYEGKELP